MQISAPVLLIQTPLSPCGYLPLESCSLGTLVNGQFHVMELLQMFVQTMQHVFTQFDSEVQLPDDAFSARETT